VNIGAPDSKWLAEKKDDELYTLRGILRQKEFLRIGSQTQSFYQGKKNNAAWQGSRKHRLLNDILMARDMSR